MKLRTKITVDFYLGGTLIAILKLPTVLLGFMLRRNHDLQLKDRVAFLKLAGGGSLVIAYPSILGLKLSHPKCQFMLITTPSVAPFGRFLKVFDEVIVLNDRNVLTLGLTSIFALKKAFGIDTVIDLEAYNRLTTIFSLLTCARNRVSFFLESAFWRRQIATHLIYFNRSSERYRFYDQLCSIYGVTPATLEQCRELIFMGVRSAPETGERSKCSAHAPLRIGVGHACSSLSRERMLSTEQWLFFFKERFNGDEHLELHFFGTTEDQDAASRIIELLQKNFPNFAITDHCGVSLETSLRKMLEMDEVWGIDSALIHFSRLFKVPTMSFWGPTNPATLLRPIQGLRETIRYEKLPCSPCVHVAFACPCRGNNVCMKNLTRPTKDKVLNPTWVTE